jgi:hypothetical protein
MQYPDYKYVDSAVGGVDRRNNVRLASDVLTGTDVYKTYFRFPQPFADHVRKTQSVSGYSGFAYADYFPIDIDCKDDLPKALDLLQAMMTMMEVRHDVNTSEIWFFFSGSKGFHVYIPAEMIGITPSPKIALYFKRFAKALLEPMGIKYDPTIYDSVRLWRANNTINSKSGLYKVQLSPAEVYQEINDITKLAKAPRKVEHVRDVLANESLSALYASIQEDTTINGDPVTTVACSRYEKLCYHKMMQGVGEGKRDAICFRLAGHWRKQGLSSDLTEGMMQAWNRKNTPPMAEREISDKVRSAYRDTGRFDFGCNDEILREYCSDQCYLKTKSVKEEPTSGDVLSFEELARGYKQYVMEAKQSRIVIPIPDLGPAMRGISPGECLYMIARAGVGKTAGMINLFQWISRENREPFIFFSMEQPAPQVFERMAQVATKLSGFEIEGHLRCNSPRAQWIIDTTRKSFENIYVVERAGLAVDDISDIIRSAETQRIGKKVRLIGLDYMGLLSGKGKDLYQQVSGQARDLQRLMKDIKTAGIVLAQVNRQAKDGNEALTMDMIRDSGAVEEVATFIIGMWREKDTERIHMKLLKNRHGQSGATAELDFLKPSLRFDDPKCSMWDDKIVMAEQFGQEVTV